MQPCDINCKWKNVYMVVYVCLHKNNMNTWHSRNGFLKICNFTNFYNDYTGINYKR